MKWDCEFSSLNAWKQIDKHRQIEWIFLLISGNRAKFPVKVAFPTLQQPTLNDGRLLLISLNSFAYWIFSSPILQITSTTRETRRNTFRNQLILREIDRYKLDVWFKLNVSTTFYKFWIFYVHNNICFTSSIWNEEKAFVCWQKIN